MNLEEKSNVSRMIKDLLYKGYKHQGQEIKTSWPAWNTKRAITPWSWFEDEKLMFYRSRYQGIKVKSSKSEMRSIYSHERDIKTYDKGFLGLRD